MGTTSDRNGPGLGEASAPHSMRRRTDSPRLTATPAGVFVWVESDRLWLRPAEPVSNSDAARLVEDGWARLTESEWRELRGCVDGYFEAVRGG